MADEAAPDASADSGSGAGQPDPEASRQPSDTTSDTDAAQLDDDAHQFQQHAQTINNVFASRSDGGPRRVTGTIRPAEVQLALRAFVRPEGFDRASTCLASKNLAVLSGQDGVGKRTGALALLRERLGPAEPVISLPPSHTLASLVEYPHFRTGRGYLVQDWSPVGTTATTTAFDVDVLQRVLRQRGSFLVITTGTAVGERSSVSGVVHRWTAPDPLTVLDRRLDAVGLAPDEADLARLRERLKEVHGPSDVITVVDRLDQGVAAALDALGDADSERVLAWFAANSDEGELLAVAALCFLTANSGIPARRLVGVAGAELTLFCHPLDLEVIPSARLEGMEDTVTGHNGQGQPVPAGPAIERFLPTYRLGLVRPLSSTVTLKANIGEYHHAPSFLELYGDGSLRLLGNPSLVPESGTNADLALWIDRPGPRVSTTSRTTLFGALADNLIYWLPSANGPSRAENLNNARIYGVEQELQLSVGRHARLTAQATYLIAEDESDDPTTHGKQIPHHPRLSGYARPEMVRVGLPRGFELGAYVDVALLVGNYDDPANVFPMPREALVGAGASVYRPRSRLRFTVSALNLTDLQNWNFSYWPLPGRTVFVSLAYDSAAPQDAESAAFQPFGNL